MYSLYRAWLTLNPPLPPPPPTATPIPSPLTPSTPLNLTTDKTTNSSTIPDVSLQVGPNRTHFAAHQSVLSDHSGYFKAALHTNLQGPIMVPNVNVDEFSALLTFMYTGYLDLNPQNIYNILLATHILHMPKALELCRNYLVQSQMYDVAPITTHIVKPIPNRQLPVLNSGGTTITSTIITTNPTPTPSVSIGLSESTPFRSVTNRGQLQDLDEDTTATTSKRHEKKSKKRTDEDDKVVIDVACCDGPVRFKRVINKNYGLIRQESTNERHNLDVLGLRDAALNRAMTANIKEKRRTNVDENAETSTTSTETYTCLYCNHTFKSQYCYQKHARRHLNPVSVTKNNDDISMSSSSSSLSPQLAPSKREVKPLDMNVQYYPCKSCGAKFPSYYFVHKHRKLCHADEMMTDGHPIDKNDDDDDGNSDGSAIDVEGDNNNDNRIE